MTIIEKITEVINDYVSQNGSGDEKTRRELYEMVSAVYPMNENSFLPADSCYNRTNEGIGFENHVHLFEWLENGNYRVLGEDCSYTGPVYYRKRGESKDSICGYWKNGTYVAGEPVEDNSNRKQRHADLLSGLKQVLKIFPVSVEDEDGSSVVVMNMGKEICGVLLYPEAYEIWTSYYSWSEKTAYLARVENDVCKYFVDTIDECMGEVKRLVHFAATSKPAAPVAAGEHTSELSKVVTASAFEKAYKAFIGQADKNAISKKAQGSKVPYGFSEKPECDGAHFKPQYGQGATSAAPYMNWWVVSIFYLPNNGNIIMGIEEDRYPHLKEMTIKPLRYSPIGNKKMNTAVFYSATKNSVNYVELYEKFICVCEEVMRLGLK